MNNQEIFDKVLSHLRTQKVPSYDQREGCLYRGPGGTMCAVGCLIPDSAYNSGLEHEGVHSVDVTRVLGALGFTEPQLNLLGSLQSEHDAWAIKAGAMWGADQEEAFGYVAKNYELTMTEVLK